MPVYIVQHNHFDPIWRRCWDRTFDYKGKRYRSYADVEERVIDIWLESAKRGATFSEGQAVVFRKYLERNPELYDEIRKLIERGTIELTAAGETIADTNMPSGETLLRNYIMGQRYFEETFGVVPTVGWILDAFGQSAQVPQLMRGCECKAVLRRSYKRVPGIYWKGLDGTVIFAHDAPEAAIGNFVKIPPCPECAGVGCDACDSLGFADAAHITDQDVRNVLSGPLEGEPYVLVSVGGEEAIPNPRLPELVEEARRSGLDIRWGGYGKCLEHFADEIARMDDPGIEVSDEVEGNPASTGCYVTRIDLKREFRRIENMLNTAERWASIAHTLGRPYPVHCLTEAWRSLLFCAFHDAITCTHLDQPYHELMDMLCEADHEASHILDDSLSHIEAHMALPEESNWMLVYNPDSWERQEPVTVTLSGVSGTPALRDSEGNAIDVLDIAAQGIDIQVTFRSPKVPALGYAAVEIEPDAEPLHHGEITAGSDHIENEFFRVSCSDLGVTCVLDKRTGREVSDASRFLTNELILEEDIGHPWGTMSPPSFSERLSGYTTSVSVRRSEHVSEIVLTGCYKGQDKGVKLLTWRQSIKLYAGVDRIDFATEIDWDTAQRRIRVAFPTAIKTDEAFYSIPYGAIERGKYEADMSQMPSTNGDWPAVNWVDVGGDGWGVALVNTGTPSHKIEDGVIYMSLLRSPTDRWCLNEPEYYDCPDFDGARDAGRHEFHYSLIPHEGDWRSAGIEKRAREINNPMVCRMPEETGSDLAPVHSFIKFDATDNVIITAIKKAERDDSLVVRLAETNGEPGSASVEIEGAGKVREVVNYLEREAGPVEDGKVTDVSGQGCPETQQIALSPFRVATVKLDG